MADEYNGAWCVLINIPEWTRAKRVKLVNIDGVRGIDTTTIRNKSTKWDTKEDAESWVASIAPTFDNTVTFKVVHY